METETKFKGVEEIIDELIAQAKEGSCKTCQFCVDTRIYTDYHQGGEPFYCLIQGNVNPITLPEEALEREAFPATCDDGRWDEDTTLCLAFKPRTTDSIDYGDAAVSRHWTFLSCLAKAAELHEGVKAVSGGELDKLLRQLNEALAAG